MLRREDGTESNPFTITQRTKQIVHALENEGYRLQEDFDILEVPNIVNITYGRDVGYKIEQEHLGDEIESISATEIRKNMLK